VNRLPSWCRDAALLGPDAPFPIDRPFTTADLAAAGVSASLRRRLLTEGLLRPMLRTVWVASHVPDSFRLRVAALKLVVPPHAVVVDRTAAWLHGVDALPRRAIYEMPALDVYSLAGSRMRRSGIHSGTRDLLDRDLIHLDDLLVTTPLRTACDLGRRLWRYDALGAIDGFLRLGVPHDELSAEVERFRGQRGVVQLRTLVPLGDARAESQPESALRLHWHDAGLPWPDVQIWVPDERGVPRYRIDLGHRATRYGAEFYGGAFHDEDAREHDEGRVGWLETTGRYEIGIFRKEDVYGRELRATWRLGAEFRAARSSLGHRLSTVVDLGR
jgi:hypothetical protein